MDPEVTEVEVTDAVLGIRICRVVIRSFGIRVAGDGIGVRGIR